MVRGAASARPALQESVLRPPAGVETDAERSEMPSRSQAQGALLLVVLIVAALILPAAATAPTEPFTPPIVDARGTVVRTSIASLEPVNVNGTKQWLLLRGHDIWSPVVLCLDVLPGISDLPLHRRYASTLEKQYIVVGWEPRGTGKSYTGKAEGGLFVDQYVSDAIEVARQLEARFRQDRIYLVGQGFGAVVGALAAQRAPELFHALVAVDPIVNAAESERRPTSSRSRPRPRSAMPGCSRT